MKIKRNDLGNDKTFTEPSPLSLGPISSLIIPRNHTFQEITEIAVNVRRVETVAIVRHNILLEQERNKIAEAVKSKILEKLSEVLRNY